MATTDFRDSQSPTGRSVSPWLSLSTAQGRRTVLLLSMLLATAAAALLGQPRAALLADPELAFVLRGMGMIKAMIALGIAALVWWRAGSAIGTRRFLAYCAACALLAAATVLVLKLAVLVATSVVFHATLLTLGLLALGDGGLARGALRRR
jgi:hypothetical protein